MARSLEVTIEFSEPAVIIGLRPICWMIPACDGSLECRMRPVDRPCDEFVFDRIDMNIVDVPGEIVGGADRRRGRLSGFRR